MSDTKNDQWRDKVGAYVVVPKVLFKDKKYEKLSALAKLLFGFLLDRTSLSAVNGKAWVEASGSTFVYFPITEIMERCGCGHDKAAALLRELEQMGLITRTLKGKGKPYRIVVKTEVIMSGKECSTNGEKRSDCLENSEGNKTEKNKLYLNKTHPIREFERASVEQEIKNNLSYDVLIEQIDKKLLDGIVDVIVDTVCTTTPTVRVAGNVIPSEEVCRRFRELDMMDVYYVCDSLQRERGEIFSLRGYILARLYEAKKLSDTYYARWVDCDMNKKDG